MKIFDGNTLAKSLDNTIRDIVVGLPFMPVLDILTFGDDASSRKYSLLKKSLGEKLGIEVNVYDMGCTEFSETAIHSVVESDPNSGIIIQLPFPKEIPSSVLDLIPSTRDVDMLSHENSSRFYSGDFSKLSPVLRALQAFLQEYRFDNTIRDVAVIGEGILVGKPLAFYLKALGFTVHIYDNYTKGTLLTEELVITCTGVPNLITGECLKKGSSVVDFGSAVVDGYTVGDFDINSNIEHLNVVSASPGGMGPLVVRFLFLNLLDNLHTL
jgi:methylenetetrahydrofolate dehydrogenase (NADP+) / methenyltetrahydrofolate cyclohydrolase